MQNYKAIVEQVLSEFVDTVVPNDQEEQGKAQVTRIVALRCFEQDHRTGLLAKTSGNNVNGRSVDILIDGVDGSSADCCSSEVVDPGHRRIIAVWVGYAPSSDPAWIARWLAPSEDIANEPGPLRLKDAPPQPGPDPQPPDDGKPDQYPEDAPWPPPPLPTRWAEEGVEDYGYEWYAQMSWNVEVIYLNLLWRWTDFQGAANWLHNIREDGMQPEAMIEAIRQDDEYQHLHPTV